jgi:hypothetical protein
VAGATINYKKIKPHKEIVVSNCRRDFAQEQGLLSTKPKSSPDEVFGTDPGALGKLA